jgi:hypothetical protein
MSGGLLSSHGANRGSVMAARSVCSIPAALHPPRPLLHPSSPPTPSCTRQVPKSGRGKKGSRPVNRDRFVSKMFLRGDSVILVLRNPK